MANHKSAAKRARQTIKKQTRNLSVKRAVRTVEKNLRTAIESKELENAQKLLLTFTSKIGKAAQKGIYHAKTASRKIGRLSAQVHQLTK